MENEEKEQNIKEVFKWYKHIVFKSPLERFVSSCLNKEVILVNAGVLHGHHIGWESVLGQILSHLSLLDKEIVLSLIVVELVREAEVSDIVNDVKCCIEVHANGIENLQVEISSHIGVDAPLKNFDAINCKVNGVGCVISADGFVSTSPIKVTCHSK